VDIATGCSGGTYEKGNIMSLRFESLVRHAVALAGAAVLSVVLIAN
jgi:hypothetical protein